MPSSNDERIIHVDVDVDRMYGSIAADWQAQYTQRVQDTRYWATTSTSSDDTWVPVEQVVRRRWVTSEQEQRMQAAIEAQQRRTMEAGDALRKWQESWSGYLVDKMRRTPPKSALRKLWQ